MILSVTIIGLLANNWHTFSIVWVFLSVSRQQVLHYRDLIVITVFFFHLVLI